MDEICNEIRKLRRFHVAVDVNHSTPPKFVTRSSVPPSSLCEMLSSRYRWQPNRFVLTGAIALVAAMDVKFLGANRVHLTIDPALSPSEVANIYK